MKRTKSFEGEKLVRIVRNKNAGKSEVKSFSLKKKKKISIRASERTVSLAVGSAVYRVACETKWKVAILDEWLKRNWFHGAFNLV